jgi:predicted  nucleic acid-binding Zn-ribbon protein
MPIEDMSVDQREQQIVDLLTEIRDKISDLETDQEATTTELNLIKIEIQTANIRLNAIKNAVEGTLNVAIIP